jgi:predicted amidohydrolase
MDGQALQDGRGPARPRRPLRLAVVQADVARGDPAANLERARALVRRAARRGAGLVVFPEMYLTGYEVWRRLAALSLPPDAPLLAALAGEAARRRCAVQIGYPERRPDGIYNALAIIGPDGRRVATYRKMHLFGRERAHFRAGHRYVLWRLDGWAIGALICYDLEFPEPVRALALAGADLVAVSTANMAPYREAQEVYVRARARENQLFVALANRVGREDGTRFIGGSGVWDPEGRTVAHADGGPSLAVTSLDPDRVRRARRPFSYLRDRRPECYAGLARRPAAGRRGSPRREGPGPA